MFPLDLLDDLDRGTSSPCSQVDRPSPGRLPRERQRYHDVVTLAAPLAEIAATQRELHSKVGDSPFKLAEDNPIRVRYETLGENASASLNTLMGYLLDNFEGGFTNEQFRHYLDRKSRYAVDVCELASVPEGLVPLAVVHELFKKDGLFVKLSRVPHFLEFARKHSGSMSQFY
jgi:hypothetical protein